MSNLYVQGTAFHGVTEVVVERCNPIKVVNPAIHAERVRITILSRIGEIITETTITVFGEDSQELKLTITGERND